MKNGYLELIDVCRLLGRPQTSVGRRELAAEVRRRVALAKGKLDRYDPRRHTAKGMYYRFTQASLRYIFPEHYDRKDEIEKKLAAQFKDIKRALDELSARIAQEGKLSRARDQILADAVREAKRGGQSAA